MSLETKMQRSKKIETLFDEQLTVALVVKGSALQPIINHCNMKLMISCHTVSRTSYFL
jgi:hypothetical protein